MQRDSRVFFLNFRINIRRVNSINAQHKIRLGTVWKLITHPRKMSDLRSKEILKDHIACSQPPFTVPSFHFCYAFTSAFSFLLYIRISCNPLVLRSNGTTVS